MRTDRHRVQASVGLLPAASGYYERVTPLEYLQFLAALYGVRPREAAHRIVDLVTWVGLIARQRSRIATFFRGMRTRLDMARALVHPPRVLFLDEFTLGLDPLGQREVLDLIRQVNYYEGVTVFLWNTVLGKNPGRS
jgi:ABC-2 type transport system ATP-binding protein